MSCTQTRRISLLPRSHRYSSRQQAAALTSVSPPAVSPWSIKLGTERLKLKSNGGRTKEGLGTLMGVYFACSTHNKTDYSFVAACRLGKVASGQHRVWDCLLSRLSCHQPCTRSPWHCTRSTARHSTAHQALERDRRQQHPLPGEGNLPLQRGAKEREPHGDKLSHGMCPSAGNNLHFSVSRCYRVESSTDSGEQDSNLTTSGWHLCQARLLQSYNPAPGDGGVFALARHISFP